MIYLAISFGPLVAAALFFYLKKNKSQAFLKMLMYSFIYGMMASVLFLLAGIISDMLGISEPRNLKRTLFFAFITVASAAELAKFIVLRYIVLKKSFDISPSDAIVLSISTAMGFSTLALIFCAADVHPISRYLPQVLFSVTYGPVNLMLAVVTGFFVGMARLLKNHIVYSLTGLLVAIFFHGMVLFCLITRDFKLLSIFAFGASMIVTFLAMKAVGTVPETSE